jgi:hypothetical protein
MYLARFCYEVSPANRERAIALIRREIEVAKKEGLKARLLVPLTRGRGAPALQLEVELKRLDQLEGFRRHGAGSEADTAAWMREFSEILLAPPAVEVLRAHD